MIQLTSCITFCLLLPCFAVAQDNDQAIELPDEETIFQLGTKPRLFNECSPIKLLVFETSSEDQFSEIGLRAERIETMAESRLRAARIYKPFQVDSTPTLLVTAFVVPGDSITAFEASVRFQRLVTDTYYGNNFQQDVWDARIIGYSGSRVVADTIFQNLSELVDEFILNYLRANDEHCN